MSKRKPRFALRKVRDGRVKIDGHWYVPENRGTGSIPYDGRLDGLRLAFARYSPDFSFVSLWGTERRYKGNDENLDWPGPNCIEGTFQWDCWRKQGATP